MSWNGESRRHSLARRGVRTASGITTPVVHRGTTAGPGTDFKRRYRPKEQLGFGIHFTEDIELAEKYAYDPKIARAGKSPYVHHAILHMENPLIANKIYYEGEPEYDLAFEFMKDSRHKIKPIKDERGIYGIYLQNAIDTTSPERAERIIREHGYDGVIYTVKLVEPGLHNMGRVLKKATGYIVFNPEQIEVVEFGGD